MSRDIGLLRTGNADKSTTGRLSGCSTTQEILLAKSNPARLIQTVARSPGDSVDAWHGAAKFIQIFLWPKGVAMRGPPEVKIVID